MYMLVENRIFTEAVLDSKVYIDFFFNEEEARNELNERSNKLAEYRKELKAEYEDYNDYLTVGSNSFYYEDDERNLVISCEIQQKQQHMKFMVE